MLLKQQLVEDMKLSMKSRETVKLGVIRYLLSEIKNTEIDHGEQDDAGIQKIIAKQIKQFKDAVEEFRAANRMDIVADEEQKIAIMESYLPAQMSDEELAGIVAKLKAEYPDEQMGQLIGKVKAEIGNAADGARIAAAVKAVFAQ